MTMMEATFEGMPGLIAPARSTARSDPAKNIEEMLEEIRRHLLLSYALSNPVEQALTELHEVLAEASREGWDGYDARPLSPLSCDFAIRFLNALPTNVPFPEVSAGTDGEVSFDWIFGERKALTVSIGPTGRCTFAWMFGQRTYRGTDWIDDEIPEEILSALGKLVKDKAAQAFR
jgi:hypothetical protein